MLRPHLSSPDGNNRFWSRVRDKLLSCVPAPPVLSLCGAAGSRAAGWSPASCPGSVSVEEEGRSGGGCSYVALWRAGFASLFPWRRLSYSIQLWDGLCIWKHFPAASQWPSVSPPATSSSSSSSQSTVCVGFRSSTFRITHLHIWIRVEIPTTTCPYL